MKILKRIAIALHLLVALAIVSVMVAGHVTFGDFTLMVCVLIFLVLPSLARLTR